MPEKSWEPVLLQQADDAKDLPALIDDLLANQRKQWETFQTGEQLLRGMRSKVFSRTDGHVVVQANPGRQTSTNARVDHASIAARPCFLCPENIPAAERGIGFGDFVLLPNPYPIVRRHLTIPLRRHIPQRIAGNVDQMLELAKGLGPRMLVFYNGASCGASAPDHFHFQACASADVPLLSDLTKNETQPARAVTATHSFGRRFIVFRSTSSASISESVQGAISALSAIAGDPEEPMFNLILTRQKDGYLACLFPRARHRPARFSAKDASRLAISPAALEMSGLLVVAEIDHFDLVDEETALAIYDEVSLQESRFKNLFEEIT